MISAVTVRKIHGREVVCFYRVVSLTALKSNIFAIFTVFIEFTVFKKFKIYFLYYWLVAPVEK